MSEGADVTQPRRAGRLSGAIVLAVLLANGNSNVELFAWPASPQRGAMSPIQRQTTFGLVVGTDLSAANGTYAWKGVPYAKPPVGELRWKAPADPDAMGLAQAHAAVRSTRARRRAASMDPA